MGGILCADYKLDSESCKYYGHKFPPELSEIQKEIILLHYLDDPEQIGRLVVIAARKNYMYTPLARVADKLMGRPVAEEGVHKSIKDLSYSAAGIFYVNEIARNQYKKAEQFETENYEQFISMGERLIAIAGQYLAAKGFIAVE